MKGNFQSIKRHIKSIRSTGKITNAMKTVAVSKYNRVLKKSETFLPYYDACADLLRKIGTSQENCENRGDKTVYVILTANRGLCGTYNGDIVRFFEELAENNGNYACVVCGKWGENYFNSKKVKNVIKTFSFPDIPEYEDAVLLSSYLKDLYENDLSVGKIVFITQQFKNILFQNPGTVSFLPVDTNKSEDNAVFAYSPEKEKLSGVLLNQCLNAVAYRVILNAAVGAHGAMFAAMRTAADNSAEMLAKLELNLNRMRQDAVTTQVIEVASGNVASDTQKGGD